MEAVLQWYIHGGISPVYWEAPPPRAGLETPTSSMSNGQTYSVS